MAFRYNIRFSGARGQGLILGARILAEAAAIYEDKNASESCSYGPEARGSTARVDIIVSDEAIDYPKVESADFLLVLTQEAYDKHVDDCKSGGIVAVDENIETGEGAGECTVFSVPFTAIAKEECGRVSMVNIVALGFFAGTSDVVSEKAIRQAILSRAPKMSEESYIRAFEAGLRVAGNAKGLTA
jgi:2-oxoglutarate ferredoxin oxidoreductase subunit gamma